MTEPRWNPEKPLAIIAVCIVGIINSIQMINLILSPMSRQAGSVYPLYFACSVVLGLVCIVALWFLKRWAAFIYGALLICNQLVLLFMGYWSISNILILTAIILLMLKNLDRMS